MHRTEFSSPGFIPICCRDNKWGVSSSCMWLLESFICSCRASAEGYIKQESVLRNIFENIIWHQWCECVRLMNLERLFKNRRKPLKSALRIIVATIILWRRRGWQLLRGHWGGIMECKSSNWNLSRCILHWKSSNALSAHVIEYVRGLIRK